jgi:hypothetical protein
VWQKRQGPILLQRDSRCWGILDLIQSLLSESGVTAVNAKKLSQIADFVRDERRLDAAFANVQEGIESGAISVNDLPIAAGPIKPVTLGQGDAEYAASMVEKISGVALDDGQRADLLNSVQSMPSDGTLASLIVDVDQVESLSALAKGLKEVQAAGIYDSLFTQPHN